MASRAFELRNHHHKTFAFSRCGNAPTSRAAAWKAASDLYADLSARNESWRKVYADYAKFRSDQNLWFRFTEATFDRFMQAQKL